MDGEPFPTATTLGSGREGGRHWPDGAGRRPPRQPDDGRPEPGRARVRRRVGRVQVERAEGGREGLISRFVEGASSEMWISSFVSCLLSGSLFSKYAPPTRSIFYNGHRDIETRGILRMRPL